MESSDRNVDRWADDRLSSLEPPSDWLPNAGRALGQLRARGQARRTGTLRTGTRRIPRLPWLWAAAAAVAVVALAGVILFPLRTPKLVSPLRAPILVGQVGNLRRMGNPPGAGAGGIAKTPDIPVAPAAKPAPKPAPKPDLAPPDAEPPPKNFKESGSPAAPITVEVYLDYECPPCAAFYREIVPPLIARYVRTGVVRLLHRDLPLPGHQHAVAAARYTNAAGRTGNYDAAVDQVFKTLAVWSRDGDIDAQLARVLPAEAMQTVRDLVIHDPGLDSTVADDVAMARRDQIHRTPTIVIVSKGERTVLGPITSFDALRTQLDQLLAPQAALQQPSAPNAGNLTSLEDFKAGDAARETWDLRATDILKAMEVGAGDWVAEVGAGYYAMRLSPLVGPSGGPSGGPGGGPSGGPGGKVFAEDISDTSLVWLDRRVKLFHLPNVEVVKGAADDPKLPAASLAAVLVVNSYHHFAQYQAMAAQILRALKPGGRL